VSVKGGALLLGAVVAIVLSLASGAVAKPFAGVVRDLPTARPRAHVAAAANLPYAGGPVLHSNRTHVIFWQPAGSRLSYDPGYEAQVELFMARVARDSHRPTNVYGLSGQYTDSGGPAAYDSTYGGAVLATDPLPPSRCIEPAESGPGWSVCLTDAQLSREIEGVVAADRLPRTPRDVFFLVLPNGLGTCETSGPSDCALGGIAAGSFCGYHSTSTDGTILYAVIPYNAVPGHCQSANPRPDASTADPSISTLSHEHNELVTDPLGNGWIDAAGLEDGDRCVAQYGSTLGGSGAGEWNEVIAGGHYFLQEEWSNQDHGCRPRPAAASVTFAVPKRVPARRRVRLAGHVRLPHGSILAYDWFFGDPPAGHHRVTAHAFSRPGTYRVILRVTDSAQNWTFASHTVNVTHAAS